MNAIRTFFESKIDVPIGDDVPGFSGWLRGTIRKVEDNSMTLEVVIRPDMCNPAGTLHGGVHMAILDEVIGMTVAAMGNETHFVTLNMTSDILRSAVAGEVVTAVSQVVKPGRKAIHIIGSLTNAQGKELCRCTQNMVSIG